MKWNILYQYGNPLELDTGWDLSLFVDAKMNSTSASSLTAMPLKRKNDIFARLILVLAFEPGQEIKSFRVSNSSRHLNTKSEFVTKNWPEDKLQLKVLSLRFGMWDLHASWYMHSQVIKKSSPSIPLLQDELASSDDASLRMTAFFLQQ